MAATGRIPPRCAPERERHIARPFDERDVPLDGRSNLLAALPWTGANAPLRFGHGHLGWPGAGRSAQKRVAIVGTTALGTRDGVSTAFDTLFPGVEVQATVADNLLRGDFISSLPSVTVEIAGVLLFRHHREMLIARLGLAWGSVAAPASARAAWRGTGWIDVERGVLLAGLPGHQPRSVAR